MIDTHKKKCYLDGDCLGSPLFIYLPRLVKGMNTFNDIADKVYQDVQAQQKRGNRKAGIPEGASRELNKKLRELFISDKRVKWEDVLQVYKETEQCE